MTTVALSRPSAGGGPPLPPAEQLAAEFVARGHAVLLLPDLYDLPDDSPLWGRLAGLGPEVVLLGWLHPRALEWLLRRRGVDCGGWRLLDLRTYTAANDLLAEVPPALGQGHLGELPEQTGERWYPVVDLSRCTNCGHCLEFCLFGVYETGTDDRVCVVNPDSCKAGCPACSRVCPAGAIMFPRYDRDPAIAGAPGQFVTRDAEARRMFYARTEQPCPLCAARGDSEIGAISADGCCPECGRELELDDTPPSPALQEIDDLIAQLDELDRGRRGDGGR